MKNFEIITACEKYIDDLEIIENLSFKIPWSRQSLTDEIMGNKAAIYFCAVTEGKAVGYAGMWKVCDEGHITNIAVHPEYRKSGVGSALMEALIAEAKERGITALTLEVRKSNYPALALYRKYGFGEGGMRKSYYADNHEDALIMWLRFKT